jgi:hypothetical protein
LRHEEFHHEREAHVHSRVQGGEGGRKRDDERLVPAGHLGGLHRPVGA